MSSDKSNIVYFGLFVDSESTQASINDAALGRRADLGIAEILESFGYRPTYHVLPGDAEANASLYQDLHQRGCEIGLHIHPATQGYGEFFGVLGPDDQRKVLIEARDRAEAAFGFKVGSLCIGYASVNDHSYGVFHELGFRHGITCIPSRVLPECASVHAGAPLNAHYAHRYNRLLEGDLDYVEVPVTVDPDSRMWGGKHPQDLRVELVDAKNHYYTMRKSIERQLRENPPVKYLLAITHNVFDYSDPANFRRQTLIGMLESLKRLAGEFSIDLQPATIGDLAAHYRKAVPLGGNVTELKLDRRGYQPASPTASK